MWLLAIAIFPFFSCPLLTAFVDTGSPHFPFLQGTGQADQYCKMHFILCPLLPLHLYQKQKDYVPEGGLRILPSCYLWCSGGIFSKGCWCCFPRGWLGEQRGGQEQPGRTKGCSGSAGKGWPQQRPRWWLWACPGTVHTRTQWEPVWRAAKETGTTCAAIWGRGGDQFMLCCTQFLFLKDQWNYRKCFFLWYSASIAEPFLQIYRSSEICMLLLDDDSVFQGSRSRLSLLPLPNLLPTLSCGGWKAMKAVGEGDLTSCGEWKSSPENGEQHKHI